MMISAAALLLAATTVAQAQQGSLADAARQARAQKQAQPQADSRHAQQIADQLSEEQNTVDAPGGFKLYQASDYRLWVPAPFNTTAHDDAGPVLLGPQVGFTHMMVLAGSPLLLAKDSNDLAFHDLALKFSQQYSRSTNCEKATLSGHEAYRCSLAGGLLAGKEVSGTGVFVRGPRTVAPVLCVALTGSASRDVLNNPNSSGLAKLDAKEVLQTQEKDYRTVWDKCETVLKSIDFKTSISQAVTQSTPGAAPQTQAAPVGSANSLADVAQHIHQNPGQPVPAAPAAAAAATPAAPSAPEGGRIHAFNYCKSTRDCWNASVIVPADAKLVSSDCKQFVFETKVQGTTFLLLAGQGDGCGTRAASDANLVRWKQLVDPENLRAPGTSSTVSSLEVKLDGKPAVITTMKFKRGLSDWEGKRAEVEANGLQVVVGCMAPRDQFPDVEPVCSALISSLRLP